MCSVLEVKRSKILQKLNKRHCFCLHFLVYLDFTFFCKSKLIYTINIWFNFMFGSFSEQDCLLNLIIVVYTKR